MGEYSELTIEQDDIFQSIKDASKDSRYWITKNGQVNMIKDLESSHLEDIDKMFKTTLLRLVKVKFELLKRKIFNMK